MLTILEGWYYLNADALTGPIPTEDLLMLLHKGAINTRHRVWQRLKRGKDTFFVPIWAATANNPFHLSESASE
jgi:hypothetical protein